MASAQAVAAADFVNSIGVNTHLDFTWSSYNNTSLVISEINYLGVKNIRDAMASQYDPALFRMVAAATGATFDVYLGLGMSISTQINQIIADAGIIRYAEGPNESDGWTTSFDGLTGFAATAAMQQALYTAVTTNAATADIPVIGPSYGNLGSFATAPNTAADSNYGNTHEYFGTGNPPAAGLPPLIADAQLVSGSNPLVATEAGYYTGSSPSTSGLYSNSGVDQLTQAKYTLTLLFDDWQAGIKSTYLYDLMDDVADPNNTNFHDHYGLFNADGTPKLAATALHNLIAVLADSGTDTLHDSLGYQLVGMPVTASSLLMEKSDGSFDIALWNDVRLQDAVTSADISVPVSPVTVNFGQLVESVSLYDPLLGTTAVSAWSDVQTVTLPLSDHPVIISVTLYPAGVLSLGSFVLGEAVSGNTTTGNLWGQLIANATASNPNELVGLAVSAVGTVGATGTVQFNQATQTLTYQAPAYNPFNPTDSFTYTLSDSHGDSITGTVAITEVAPANTLYGTLAGATATAPASAWTLDSMATGESLNGSAQGGDVFNLFTDTNAYAGGAGNTIQGGDGNHVISAGTNNAVVSLGNGNNQIGVTGTGAVITTGNGNNSVWKPSGSATIIMGNGNDTINAGGTGNSVSIGTGTSTINIGIDGSAAGQERVTVGGGTNTVNVAGAGDAVLVSGGIATVVAGGGQATITLDAGSSQVVADGAANRINIFSGANLVDAAGNANTITAGAGSDTIWTGGSSNLIAGGAGTGCVTVAGGANTITAGAGGLTLTDFGTANTIVLAPPGAGLEQIYGGVLGNGDLFDLRPALAATNWDRYMADLGNYLSVRMSGNNAIVSIDADGTGSGTAKDIAVINGVGTLSLSTLLSHAILPNINVPAFALSKTALTDRVQAGQSSGNLWSQLTASGVTGNTAWQSGVIVSAVNTVGTTGTVALNAATQTLTYQAPAYNPFNPTDSFTYTLSDGHGDNVTGTLAITEVAPANTLYGTLAGATTTAPASAWTLYGMATAETLNGSAQGGDVFNLFTDTNAYAGGAGNTIQGGNGNHVIGAGTNNAVVRLGNGNNQIGVTGTGAVITTGNGNNSVWKPSGSATIIMGNGNDTINAGGTGNNVSIGTGTSTINLGIDGAAAGQERVTVGGGTNTVSTGGAGDTVLVETGIGNTVVASGGSSTLTVDAGSNTITALNGANTVTLVAGSNSVAVNGNANTVTGGSGSDTVWAGGNSDSIVAGTGRELITFTGQHDTINVTHGIDIVTDQGSANTFILAAPGGTATQINGNVIAQGDLFDLRAALGATNWDGQLSDLSNYLSVRAVGAISTIFVDPDGNGSAVPGSIAVLNNSANVTYQVLLAHAIT